MGRPESLQTALKSLEEQTYRDFETILVEEEGELARLRNEGARRAKGSILIFTDDDVLFSNGWLEAIVETFNRRSSIGGVSGPAVIEPDYRRNRDLFRYPIVKRIYDYIFLEGMAHLPGHITRFGTWTTGACDPGCDYNGAIDFLEACNMAFKREAFERVGGFDEAFKGVGDWSEPDLAYRVKEYGFELWFNSDAKLWHRPSRSGAFKKRAGDSKNRIANYYRFADRHLGSNWRIALYKLFIGAYYGIKSLKR